MKRQAIVWAFLAYNTILFSQNVGIGTQAPQARLHITVPNGFSNHLLLIDTSGATAPHLIVRYDGSVGIGSVPTASAVLEIYDTTRGLLIPRMSDQQRNAIMLPATGLLVYQLTTPKDGFWFFDGTQWRYVVTDKDLLWKHSGDSLFSLPDTAVVIRGVGSPIPGGPSSPYKRYIIFKSRSANYYIQLSPHDGNTSYPAQGIEFRGTSDSTAQYIDFAPNGGDFSGRIIYNDPQFRKGIYFATNSIPRVFIDSLGRTGIRMFPTPEAWEQIGDQASLYVRNRIVAGGVYGYPNGSELPYLPYHNPCYINLSDTSTDIGDTLSFWLARCKYVVLVLDSGKTYKWNTKVILRSFQSLHIYTQITRSGYTSFTDTATTTVLINKVDTVTRSGVDYYVPTKLLIQDYASFRSERVFYKFVNPTNLSLSPLCNDQGIFTFAYGATFSKIFIHQGKYEGDDAHFIKVSADAWNRVLLANTVIRNTGTNTIHPVAVSNFNICHGTANGAVVGRVEVILGPNVQWDTDPRVIYNQ